MRRQLWLFIMNVFATAILAGCETSKHHQHQHGAISETKTSEKEQPAKIAENSGSRGDLVPTDRAKARNDGAKSVRSGKKGTIEQAVLKREPVSVSRMSASAPSIDPLTARSAELPEVAEEEPGDPLTRPEVSEISPQHAEDYTWVRGQLEYRHRTGKWQLRYAPHWKEDRYGGSLRLRTDAIDGKDLQEGAWIRAEGSVRTTGEHSTPEFHVSRIEQIPAES